jgi:hypothetical protein
MELVLDRCSIVIVGAWNLAIFRQDWVGKRLFPDEPQFEFGFSLAAGAGAVMFYKMSNVMLVASAGKIEFKPLKNEDAAFNAVEESAKTVLKHLPETPVEACGINFGFDATDASLGPQVVALGDTGALSKAQASVLSTRITHAIEYAGGRFNFTVEHETGKPALRIDFNHHFSVRSSHEAHTVLDGNTVRRRNASRNFLDAIYPKKAGVPS